jgi:hypothetical protein
MILYLDTRYGGFFFIYYEINKECSTSLFVFHIRFFYIMFQHLFDSNFIYDVSFNPFIPKPAPEF